MKNKTYCDPNICYSENGSEPIIKDLDITAHMIYKHLQHGMSFPQVTSLVNLERSRDKLEPISCSTIQRFINASSIIIVSLRVTLKSGKDDPKSAWAIAIQAQCEMLKEMIRLGNLDPTCDEVINSPLRPMYRVGVVFFDEKHMKCILGPVSSK